jgi:hypothetical protein
VTSLLILNVALFLPAVLGGAAMAAFGWVLAGRGADEGDSGGGGQAKPLPLQPSPPSPVEPRATAARRDLARSA